MRIWLPLMVQDPTAAGRRYVEYEQTDLDEDLFLDGPTSRRVAVLDFDPDTGRLLPGARFVPPGHGRKFGYYQLPGKQGAWPPIGQAELADLAFLPTFIQVSAFAAVLKTIHMFEKPGALGRPLTWAFDRPQLFVIPRAAQTANAFYERDSGSLNFGYFPSNRVAGNAFTSLSRDIIAHETGHAILDGILPELFNSLTPETLALHEAVADLCAMFSALDSRDLVDALLKRTGGDIRRANAVSAIAEELGSELDSGRNALRHLDNQRLLPQQISAIDPHALSEVLTGALYPVLVALYEKLRPVSQTTGYALANASNQLRRMLFRALDYLPPANVSFADYGRAIVAADRATFPDKPFARERLCAEFVSRAIAPSARALDPGPPKTPDVLHTVDFDSLLESDWAAYEFANQNRGLLRIPRDVAFRVLPRQQARKLVDGVNNGFTELIYKVTWNEEEPAELGASRPAQRQVVVGTTLVADWNQRTIRSLLTSESSRSMGDDERFKGLQQSRTSLLTALADAGMLGLGPQAHGPDGRPLRGVLQVAQVGDALRVRGVARLLHML